jgi:hypothetical protein
MSPVLNHHNKILSMAIILKALVHNEAIKTLVHHEALKTLSFLQIFSNVNGIKHELSQSSEFLRRFASKTKLVNELPILQQTLMYIHKNHHFQMFLPSQKMCILHRFISF